VGKWYYSIMGGKLENVPVEDGAPYCTRREQMGHLQ